MHRTPARLGRWFALTLALPAAFAILWAWLVPGGVVARAEEGERKAAERVLGDAVQQFERALHETANESVFVIRLDDERRVVAPFAPVVRVPVDNREAGVAEDAAMARLREGRDLEALQFFAHAASRQSLTPEGWLAYANAAAKDDPQTAQALLAKARAQHASAMVGPVPFDLAALLIGARYAEEAADAQRDEFCRLVQEVPAALVPTVVADFQESAAALQPVRAQQLLAAAEFVDALAGSAVPELPMAIEGGAVCLALDASKCVAMPAGQVADLQEGVMALASKGGATVLSVGQRDGAVADRSVPSTEQVWSASVPVGATPNSVILQRSANGCLALALVTLVLGNLLLLRLTRRESQLVRLRADFVDVVSHELRTPLTALSLKSEMLAMGDVPAKRRDHYLNGLHQDVLRLNDQLERILDFGRLQKGAKLRREPLSGRSLLAHGLRSGRPALRLVAQHVDVNVPRELPTIVGDVEVLGRALRNLLENAAKYAPAGSTVGVRAFARGGELCVEITDQGPGVAAEERESIFQPFVRGEHATSGTPGSGLGLALVAAAAEGHGGRVTVDQQPGGGAVFTLHLPTVREGGIA